MAGQSRNGFARLLSVTVLAASLWCWRSDGVYAAKFNRVLDIGDKAPVWSGLPGTDGKRHSLSGLKSADVVVVVFFCNHCPVAKAYEQRLLKLAAVCVVVTGVLTTSRGIAFATAAFVDEDGRTPEQLCPLCVESAAKTATHLVPPTGVTP